MLNETNGCEKFTLLTQSSPARFRLTGPSWVLATVVALPSTRQRRKGADCSLFTYFVCEREYAPLLGSYSEYKLLYHNNTGVLFPYIAFYY